MDLTLEIIDRNIILVSLRSILIIIFLYKSKDLICLVKLSPVFFPLIKSDTFSAIIIIGALIFPVSLLITDPSTILRPEIPFTLKIRQ